MQVSVYNHQFKNSGSGFFSKLLAIFIIVPLIEIYLLIKIGQYIGAVNTILLVVITAILGSALMKLEGLRVWFQFQKDLSQGKIPQDGLLDGLLILIGGIFLLTPGILTDICGFLLLIPFTRHWIKKYFKNRLAKKIFGRDKIVDM